MKLKRFVSIPWFLGTVAALAVSLAACAQILGVDEGLPFPDAGDASKDATRDGDAAKNHKDAASDVIVMPVEATTDVKSTAEAEFDNFTVTQP